MDNDKLNMMFDKPAKRKWRKLIKDGYHGISIRSGGVVFGTSRGGEAGHISWHGKVTWLSK